MVWEGRWENFVKGRRLVEEVGSLIVMKLVERKSSISDCGSAVRVGCSTYPGLDSDVPFDCDPVTVLLSVFADLFFTFNSVFSALRVALSEAASVPLTLLLTDRCSATSRPLSCSLASFFDLFDSFRASFESLPILFSPSAAAVSTSPTPQVVGRTSSIPWPAPGSLANFFSLFASLRSSLEGSLLPSSPLPTKSFGKSSCVLFFDFFV